MRSAKGYTKLVVILLTVTLGISIAGMIVLILMKRYELNTGRIFLARSRPAIGEFFHRKLVWLEHVLPGLVRGGVSGLWAEARRIFHIAAAWAVIKIEQGLEYALRRVRHTTQAPKERGQETSTFLREVAEHKKKLQDENPDRGTIVEE